MTTVPYEDLKLKDARFTNPRQHSGLADVEIHELALQIALHGLLNPLHVTPDNVITAGQRRYLAIGHLVRHVRAIAAELNLDLPLAIARAATLHGMVPVIVDTGDPDDVAMVDNLSRVDLSSYEIAAEIARRHLRGDTGARISTSIGRSPSYVSKAYKAWRGAGEELKAAWRAGTVSYDRVKELADLHEEEQERAISGGKPRGGYNRPGIEAVKHVLDTADRAYGAQAAPESYARAVLDVLRWVAGMQSSAKFAEFMESIER